MGWFDAIRGKRRAPPETPADLFAALRDAVKRGDHELHQSLCREHTDAIVEAFPVWQKSGKEFLADPDALDALIQTLGHTAQFLDQGLGRPECWALLTAGNPFERWEKAREEIMERVRALDHAGAIDRAHALLTWLESLVGSARDEPEELTRGLLGQLLRQVGRTDEAVGHLEWTLARCEARRDAEGVGVYLRQLHEADRDRGRPSSWWPRLAAHAEQQGDAGEAAWYRRVHARFPGGEPLLRMIAMIDEQRFELDEHLPLVPNVKVAVLFQRNRETLGAAHGWIERGREHGGRGELAEAIACFESAARIDPNDPDSRYQQAFTEMLLDRPANALRLYDDVERLAPGWFHSRTWRSLAQRQLAGEIPHEAVRVVDLLQDGGLTAAEKLEAASLAILRWPRMPELHLYRGHALEELGRPAEPAWLAGLEVGDAVPSTRSRLLLALARLDEVLDVEGADLMSVAAARIQLGQRPAYE